MKLNGCVNDCANNVQLCVNKLGVPSNEIMVLTDAPCPGVKGASPPTKQNILHSMQKLVAGAQAGDMLYFSYSGHGTQVVDRTGEEADGMDEAIVPTDYDQTGRVITDDELYAYMVQPLPEGVLLTCMFDCCHAGTILDLDSCEDGGTGDKKKAGKKKYKKGKNTKDLIDEFAHVGLPRAIPPLMDYEPDELPVPMCQARGIGGPAVICFSGCRDDQTSLDVTLDGKPCGALTNCTLKALNAGGDKMDYQTLFRTSCDHMNTLRRSIGALTQQPQMSFTDAAEPASVKFCQPGAGGFSPAYPSPSDDVKPHKGKKEKAPKEKKEKPPKEKKEKAPKEGKDKKGKDKKGKNKDIDGDSDDDSEDEHYRKADYGRQVLAAALGRF